MNEILITYIFILHFNYKATFSFWYNLHNIQEMSGEKNTKCCCINLHLKLNSGLQQTDLYEELKVFRKIIPSESSALECYDLYFEIISQKFILMLLQPINTLNSFSNSWINRKMLLKIKKYQKNVLIHSIY